jgi:hypothetical protein
VLAADPSRQRVRFGVFRERGLDLNLDGEVGDDFGVAVVDSGEHGLVAFLDTDQDLSFADETMLSDWNTSHRTAEAGQDRPETTDRVEVRPFGLNECQLDGMLTCGAPVDERGDAWSLVIGSEHGTMTASTAAGHDFGPNSEHFDGVAPGAELWAVQTDPGPDLAWWQSEIARDALLAAREGADVMNMSLVMVTPLGPPDEPIATLIDNLAEAYGTLAVTGSGNTGPGIQAIGGSPNTARTAVSVGAMLSSASLERLLGRPGISGNRLIYYSNHGPELDGHWTPDIVAPTSSLAAHPRWLPNDACFGSVEPASLSSEYMVGCGTSNAVPFVSGVAALLISAARAEDVAYTPHTLKRAIELGARPLDDAAAYGPEASGHGLVNVGRAYTWLKRLGREGTLDRDVDTVVVNDTLGTGQGIYQRSATRDVEQVTVATRDATTRTYELDANRSWIHLDRVFLELPGASGGTLGTAQFEVRIDPSLRTQPGLHTGVVTVDDPTTLDPADHEMLVTIVTPHRFDAGNRLRFTGSGKTGITAEDYRKFFVHVPAGTPSLEVALTRPADDPAGVHAHIYSPSPLLPGPILGYQLAPRDPLPGATTSHIWSNPKPGTWEITLYAHEMDRQGPVVKRHAYDLTINLTPGEQ